MNKKLRLWKGGGSGCGTRREGTTHTVTGFRVCAFSLGIVQKEWELRRGGREREIEKKKNKIETKLCK